MTRHTGGGIDPADIEPTNGDAVDVDSADVTLVLHEEQLRPGTRHVPVERVVLRRTVVTEEQTITVPVRREVVEVLRVPIDGGAQGDLGQHTGAGHDDDTEVTLVLHEERPVVTLEVVETERVILRRTRHTDHVWVSTDVAREVAEVEADDLHDAVDPHS